MANKGELPFKRLGIVLVLFLAIALPSPASPKHALAKVALAPVAVAKHAPKALSVTIGSVLFSTEAVVDVVHLGTAALDRGAALELKHNPFHYANAVVAKADSGLEKAGLYFFHAQL